jgi:molybdopterin-containing oxidoreductase family membrane subunit
MWASVIFAAIALIMLLVPRIRRNTTTLAIACIVVFASLWIDKGLGLVIAGFVPSPLGVVTEYWPTWPEFFISVGIYAMGALIITVFYKMVLSVRGEYKEKPFAELEAGREASSKASA